MPRTFPAPLGVLHLLDDLRVLVVSDRTETPVTISGLTAASTVGDLATAVGRTAGLESDARADVQVALIAGCDVVIDAIPVESTARLIDTPLRQGSVVEICERATRATQRANVARPVAMATACWLTGPDAGHSHPLVSDTVTVGSSRHADISVDDPQLPTHHGQFTRVDGSVRYIGFGLGAGARSASGTQPADRPLSAGDSIIVGSSIVTIAAPTPRSSSPRPDRSHGGWTEPVFREHQQPTTATRALDVPPFEPAPTRQSTGLLATGLTVLAGLVLAIIIGQPLMVIMVAVGAVAGAAAGLGTWRRQRREQGEHGERQRRLLVEFSAHVGFAHQVAHARQRDHAGLATALQAIPNGAVWQQRSDGELITVLGYGNVAWQPNLSHRPSPEHTNVVSVLNAHSHLNDVPVTARLAPGDVLAISGAPAAAQAVARGILVTLASTFGPAEWVLDIDGSASSSASSSVTHDEHWAAWLPHARRHAQLNDADGRCVVVVTHDVAALTVRTSPLRERLHSDNPPIVIVVVPPSSSTPSVATTTLELHLDGTASLLTPQATLPQRLRFCGLTLARARRAAAGLCRFTDPEASETCGIPNSVRLATLLSPTGIPDAASIADSWNAAGIDPRPCGVVGVGATGPLSIDLVADGPHALIAGTTGAGKSEFLRTLVLSMAYSSPPEALNFVLVDYKGGSAFDRCTALPHTIGVVTDLDDRLAERVLVSLEAELRRRERALRAAGAADLSEYRASVANANAPMARVVVVIDEFATLATELHDFVPALIGIAQRGRSLGIHLVLATQRPAGAMSDDIRANTNLRLALRVHDTADSLDVIGDSAAASIARTSPGRGVLRRGASDLVAVQSASTCFASETQSCAPGIRVSSGWLTTASTEEDHRRAREVDVLVERLSAAQALRNGQTPRPLWVAPLADQIDHATLSDRTSFGLVDHPAAQCIEPLRWDHAGGHLIVAGSLGSGCSTALHTVAMGLASTHSVDELHIAAIDSTTASACAQLRTLPHTIAAISAADRTDRRRLLRLIVRRIEAAGPDAPTRTVLLIDGFNALRAELLAAADLGELDDLERILADGPAAGVVVAATSDQPSSLPLSLMSRASARWCLRLSDPLEALSLGVSGLLDRSTPSGRGVEAESGRTFQLARALVPLTSDSPAFASRVGTSPSHRLAPLPTQISASDLAACIHGGVIDVGVGFGLTTERTARLSLGSGEHALIAGTARSGRTTLLAAIAAQWKRLDPIDTTLLVVAPRTPEPFRQLGIEPVEVAVAIECVRSAPSTQRLLLLVDDADQVVDIDGRLRDLVQQSGPAVSVIGAARTDRLREQWGHWALGLRAHSVGVLLGCLNDLDADLFGCRLPDYTKLTPATRRSVFFSRGEAEELLPVSVVA